MNQTVYQVIGFLLQYPTRQLQEVLPEIKKEVEQVEEIDIRNHLNEFLTECSGLSFSEWIDHYIHHFDFGRTTNLYMTYLKLGEQRERGLELLKLKKYFEAHGFEVTDRELPDFLPLVLEFCANVPPETSNDLLGMYAQEIEAIRKQIAEQESFYHLLLDALVIYMKKNGLLKEHPEQLAAE
jgi:nitrate reductase delta subunit